jgi:peptide/nickel transport system substrate-binding protein
VAASPEAREALWITYTPPLTYARSEGTGAKLIPGLAQTMPRLSSDGRSYAFSFRAGLRYSNGRALRASDFRRTVERARALSARSRALFGGIRRIDTDDRRRRVVIHLRRPDSTFPYALADTAAGLVPGDTPVRVRRPPPGIGPYVLGDVGRDGSFSMRRRRRLRLPGVPDGNVDRITVQIVPSQERQVREVIAGNLDYAPDPPPPELLPLVRSKYRDRYGEHRTESSYWVALNSRRKPFDDERVRRAVNFAVDGDKLRRLSLGFLDPSCNLIPQDMTGYRRLDPCPYGNRATPANLVKAQALVDKAHARGARVTLVASREGDGPRISRYFESTLDKIGLRARRRLVAGRTDPTLVAGSAQAVLADWQAGLPHPAELLRLVRGQDAAIDVEIASLAREPLDSDNAPEDWAALDRRLVEGAYVAPYGSATRSTFLSERLDFANCSRFNPVYGNDWSSFCLK